MRELVRHIVRRRPKGIIWKYHADPNAPDLRDTSERTGCRSLNPDPDFWQNDFPVWAICGPYVRTGLSENDLLFFTPDSSSSRRAHLKPYLCAGYLTVKQVILDGKAILSDPRFTARYRRNYRLDLRRHLKGDGERRTAALRSHNVIIGFGDPKRSAWLGRPGVSLRDALDEAGMRNTRLDVRRISDLNAAEAQLLLEMIRRRYARKL